MSISQANVVSGVVTGLAAQAQAAGRAFRVGMEALGSQHLAALIESLLPVLGTAAVPGQLEQLLPLLCTLQEAQERRDSLFVADLLEYELIPRLQATLLP